MLPTSSIDGLPYPVAQAAIGKIQARMQPAEVTSPFVKLLQKAGKASARPGVDVRGGQRPMPTAEHVIDLEWRCTS